MLIKGRVIKAVASRYKVLTETGKIKTCFVRGRLKLDIDIFVGDMVEIQDGKETAVITKVFPRKNSLIRPYVSNVDKLIIIVAPMPEPDFILVDKLIVNCLKEHITPVLCLNKAELLTEEERKNFFKDYAVEFTCIAVSAFDDGIGIDQLISEIDGLVCFAGQSAVGKSTLLNKIFGKEVMETGELSERIARGKNTTRYIELFQIKNGFIADTCGFSMLELEEKSGELRLYYDAFLTHSEGCRYRSCTHTTEPICGVKEAVSQGKISETRYKRYLAIFNELKEKEDTMYD